MEIVLISKVIYLLSIVAAYTIVVSKPTLGRLAILTGYAFFAVLYIAEIEYHAAVGYLGWTVINLGLFRVIWEADRC